jgi:malate dehydrogenase (oxaloacetate-decarboxylating)
VATGSPFANVEIDGRSIPIAQCNNYYIFPGVGLGIIAANANQVTDNMLMAASEALAECSPLLHADSGALLPPMADVQEVSKAIGFAVAKQAQKDKVALSSSEEQIRAAVERNFWVPNYREYRRATI